MSSKKASRQDSLFAEAESDKETGVATETSSEPANPPAYVDAPIPFTQEEIDFYALATAIQDAEKILFTEVANPKVRDLQREFMAYYAKIKAACEAVRPAERHVKIGKDSLGNEWVFTENVVETAEKAASFIYPFFLIWMTKQSLFEADESVTEATKHEIEGLKQRVAELESKNKVLTAEKGRLAKELQESRENQKSLANEICFVRGQSRLQSKRRRRLPVHPKGN